MCDRYGQPCACFNDNNVSKYIYIGKVIGVLFIA